MQHARCEHKGIRCWIGPRDIVPGTDWGEAIIDAISAARVMVLVFSSHANGSHQVKREVERAVSKGIPIIPVRIEAVAPSKSMEYFISAPHWLDALTPPLERHLESLAGMVKLQLDRLGQQPHVGPQGQPVTELPSELPRPAAEPSPEMRAPKATEVALHAPEREPLAARGAEPPPLLETLRKLRPPVRIYLAASLVLLGVAVVLLMVVRRDGDRPIEAPADSGIRVEKDTLEPNNDFRAATPLELGAWVWMSIFPTTDTDFFRIEPPGTGYIMLRVEEVPAAVDLAYQFFNEKRQPLGNGSALRVTNEPVYLSVRDDRNDGEDAMTFALSASWLPEMDRGEPNDDARRATPIQLEQQHAMAILPVGDQDWFRFEVKETGYVFAAVEDVPDELRLRYDCFDEKGGVSRGNGLSWRLDPGTYTLRVADSSSRINLITMTTTSASPIPLSLLAEFSEGDGSG